MRGGHFATVPEVRGRQFHVCLVQRPHAVLGAAHAFVKGVLGSGAVSVAADDENIGVFCDVVPEPALEAILLRVMRCAAGRAIFVGGDGRDAVCLADIQRAVVIDPKDRRADVLGGRGVVRRVLDRLDRARPRGQVRDFDSSVHAANLSLMISASGHLV